MSSLLTAARATALTALGLGLGALAGVGWWAVVDLPAYRINPDERRRKISCDRVNQVREDAYVTDPGTERESAQLASNDILGPRTRREMILEMRESPWSP